MSSSNLYQLAKDKSDADSSPQTSAAESENSGEKGEKNKLRLAGPGTRHASPDSKPPQASISSKDHDYEKKNKLRLAAGRPSAEEPTPSLSLQPKSKLALAPPIASSTRPPSETDLGDAAVAASSNRERASSKMLGAAPALSATTATIGDDGALNNKDEAEGGGGHIPVPHDTGRSSVSNDDVDESGDHAFQAVLADEEQQSTAQKRMLDDAVVASDVQVIERRWLPGRTPLIVIGVIVAIAIGVGVALGVTLGGGDDDDPSLPTGMPSFAPTDAPTMSPTIAPSSTPTSSEFSQVAILIESIFGYTVEDSASPQYRAAQWMAEVDELIDFFVDVDPDRFAQRYILAVLYYATGGDLWSSQANFLSPTEHECSWRVENTASPFDFSGVARCLEDETSGGQLVQIIDLSQNGLTGTLPVELGALTPLLALTLGINEIQGTIPPSIFSIPNLLLLYMPFNDFSGTIPTEIGQVSAMIGFWIQENSLTGTIPSEVGRLTDIVNLSIESTGLGGTIPSELYQLSSMEVLNLRGNQLEGEFAPPAGSLDNLTILSLAQNDFNGTLPADLGLKPLVTISIRSNSFSGPLPESFQQAESLELFDMADNRLSGTILEDWNSMSQALRILDLSYNQLTGTLPQSLGNLTNLSIFRVNSNMLNGTLLDGLSKATDLERLLYEDNSFTGTVPESYGQLEKLQIAWFTFNQLTGSMNFFCDGDDTLRPQLIELHADCLGEEIECDCCQICCDELDSCIAQ